MGASKSILRLNAPVAMGRQRAPRHHAICKATFSPRRAALALTPHTSSRVLPIQQSSAVNATWFRLRSLHRAIWTVTAPPRLFLVHWLARWLIAPLTIRVWWVVAVLTVIATPNPIGLRPEAQRPPAAAVMHYL